MVEELLELRDDTIDAVRAALLARPQPVRTRLPNPRADLARTTWLAIDHDVAPDRDARAEAIAVARMRPIPPPLDPDPRIAEILALATVIHSDSWLRLRITEGRAGSHASSVAIDQPPAIAALAARDEPPFVAVAHDGTERGERAYMDVALGDLHVPVRYVRFGEDCRGAAVIVDGDWREPLRCTALVAFGRPLIVSSTSGAHEWTAPAGVYDPFAPEMLAEAVRATLRIP